MFIYTLSDIFAVVLFALLALAFVGIWAETKIRDWRDRRAKGKTDATNH